MTAEFEHSTRETMTATINGYLVVVEEQPGGEWSWSVGNTPRRLSTGRCKNKQTALKCVEVCAGIMSEMGEK